VQQWLPLSAGFVHGHVAASRQRGVVLARQPFEHHLTFPYRPAHSLAWAAALTPRLGRRPLGLAVTAACRAHRVDLVHVHFGYPVADVLGAVRRLDLPLVLSLHGHDATSLPAEHYADAIKAVDAVVVPSRFLARHAVRLGFDPDRVHAIPSGIDTGFFAPSPIRDGPPEALFVGRLVAKKGLDVLLDAWATVRRALPECTLRIIGDGPLAALLTDLPPGVVHERPDPSRRATQVRDAIRGATVIVQPSRTGADGDAESLLLVNLEAQASGRPVVTTRHGGIPEFVDEGRTALVVDEGDPVGLADALVAVLGDPALAARLGSAGPSWAAAFDVRLGTARVDDLYDAVLSAR
jgi:glycosyltransferase involved in cell wall biosynthesis